MNIAEYLTPFTLDPGRFNEHEQRCKGSESLVNLPLQFRGLSILGISSYSSHSRSETLAV